MRFTQSCRSVLIVLGILLLTSCSSQSPSSPLQTAAFTISATNATEPSAYAGSCPVTLTLVGTISGQVRQTGDYQYTYQWEVSDGTKWGPRSERIAINVPQPQNFSLTDRRYDVTVRSTILGSVRLRVTDPNDILSPPVPLSVVCK